jgi:hypothetical protein
MASAVKIQQPGGDTPGVAAAPVALAGAIVPGDARYIVVLSAHADVFGVGITAMVGSMLVPPSCATTGCIVPGGGPVGICGVDSGKAAPLPGGPPGVELHMMVDGLPSGVIGEMLPVVVGTIGAGMVPNGEPGIIDDIVVADDAVAAGFASIDVVTAPGTVDDVGTGTAVREGGGKDGTAGGGGAGMVESTKTLAADVSGCWENVSGAIRLPIVGVEELRGSAWIVGAADSDGIVAVVPVSADMEATGTAGVPGAICPVGAAQVTTVPGVVGLEAGGTGASVVSGASGWVADENGLGPLSGEDTIAPGVDESPIAVVPMVETCARLASHPARRATVTNSKHRMGSSRR